MRNYEKNMLPNGKKFAAGTLTKITLSSPTQTLNKCAQHFQTFVLCGVHVLKLRNFHIRGICNKLRLLNLKACESNLFEEFTFSLRQIFKTVSSNSKIFPGELNYDINSSSNICALCLFLNLRNFTKISGKQLNNDRSKRENITLFTLSFGFGFGFSYHIFLTFQLR